MAITAAQLQVKVTADTKAAEEGLSSISAKTKETSGGFGGMLQNALSMAGGFAVFTAGTAVLSGLQSTASQVWDQFTQGQNVMAQMNAVLRSTHGAAGMTKDALVAMADAAQKNTTYQNDAVETGENMLLTFTGIGKNVFPQATQAMLDMNQAMGGGDAGLKDTAIQLGKALNDPLQGLNALKRVGVSFSDDEQKLIKHFMDIGDTASAQKVMLSELNTEFGGSAKAAGETLPGKLTILHNKLMDMGTSILDKAAPSLEKLFDKVSPLIDALGNNLPSAIDKTIGFLKTVKNDAENFIGAAQRLWTQLQPVRDIIEKVGGVLGGQLMSAVKDAQKQFAAAKPDIDKIGASLKDLQPVGEFIAKLLGGVIVVAIGLALGAFRGLIGAIHGVVEVLSGVITFISGWWDVIVGLFTGNPKKIIEGFTKMKDGIIGIVKGLGDTVTGYISGFINGIVGWFEHLFDKLIGHSIVPDLVNGIIKWIMGLPASVAGFGANLIGSLVGGIEGNAGNLFNSLKKTVGGAIAAIPGGQFLMDHLPHFATGGIMGQSGLALVGENGPEIVALPGGASVTPIGGGMSMPQPIASAGAGNYVIQLDGYTVGRLLMPYQTRAIRNATGVIQ